LRVRIPDTVAEQPIQIGKVRIAVGEEAQAFAILFARPLAGPHSPARIVVVKVRATECLPAAVQTTFNVAATVVVMDINGADAAPHARSSQFLSVKICWCCAVIKKSPELLYARGLVSDASTRFF
jgi:hypothetical protein